MEQQRYNKTKFRMYEWKDTSEEDAQNIAFELVERLFSEMANQSVKLDSDEYGICDMPYLYSERRLDSVIMPALSKICNGLVHDEVSAERHNNSRKAARKKSQGRYDYWCIYKDYSFVIEVKQSFDGYIRNKTVKKATNELWKEMIIQLKTVKDDMKYYIEKTKKIIRLGIMFVTSYTDKPPCKEKLLQFNERIPKICSLYFEGLGTHVQIPQPDMMMLWQIPDKIALKKHHIYRGTFPGLWAIVKVFDPIEHQGATE